MNYISSSISEVSATTSNSRHLPWKILRKDLKLHPYKPKLVQEFTPEHKIVRLKPSFKAESSVGKLRFHGLLESPDLSPLDYWFWSHCTERVTQVGPRTIKELKTIVEEIAAEVDANFVRASVHQLLLRAHIYRECYGTAFQCKIKQLEFVYVLVKVQTSSFISYLFFFISETLLLRLRGL